MWHMVQGWLCISAWMKYVYKHNIDRFVQFAARVWDVDIDFACPERTALEGIKRLEQFFVSIGLPVTLEGLDSRIGLKRWQTNVQTITGRKLEASFNWTGRTCSIFLR